MVSEKHILSKISQNMYTVNAEWVSPAPTMDTVHRGMGAGIYNNAIYLTDTSTNDVFRFDPNSETFTKTDDSPFPNSFGSSANQYAQYGNAIWMSERHNGDGLAYNIWTYDLSTNIFTDKNIAANSPNPLDGYSPWCGDDDYIYLTGGHGRADLHNNKFSLFDLSGNRWIGGPSLTTNRYGGDCAIASGKLYAIGGIHGGGANRFESISINGILSNSWVMASDTFQETVEYLNAVTYGTDIYVIGGLTDKVYIIDSTNDALSLSEERLAFQNGAATVIIFNHVIYSFGGIVGTNRWQKYQLAPSVCDCNVLFEQDSLTPTSIDLYDEMQYSFDIEIGDFVGNPDAPFWIGYV